MATHIDGIEIKHPCSASWAAMDGDARARFCKLCSKVVHDTTALTTCELEKMLDAPSPPCLRVHRDWSGRVLTKDRLAALAFVGLAACTGVGDTAGPLDTAETGDVVMETRTMGTGDRTATTSRSAARAIYEGVAEALAGVEVPTVSVPMMGAPMPIEAPPAPPPMMGEPMMGDPVMPAPVAHPVMMGGPSPKMGKIALPRE